MVIHDSSRRRVVHLRPFLGKDARVDSFLHHDEGELGFVVLVDRVEGRLQRRDLVISRNLNKIEINTPFLTL